MQAKKESPGRQNVVAVIPCAGRATRLPVLPCSKELYPLGIPFTGAEQEPRSRVVCDCLLEKLHCAGITDAYLVLRKGKWDIPSYLGDGSTMGMRLAYLMMGLPFGVPYTVDQAFPFVRDSLVALGFPDIIFSGDDAFGKLLNRQREAQADVVVGFFPADRPAKCDMIEVGSGGRLTRIVIKPEQTDLRYTWGIAVWTPVFSAFMHDFLLDHQAEAAERPELHIGDVIQAAIDSGMRVDAVQVSTEPYLDIGTVDDLARALEPVRQ